MKKIVRICTLIVVSIILSITVIVLIGVLMIALDHRWEYYKDTKWNCDTQSFQNDYDTLYENEILRLKEKYELDYEESVEKTSNMIERSLYCDEYTILITFVNCETYAKYDVCLYYYGDESGVGEYEDAAHVVNFINDLTNYVAYDADTEQNRFALLYDEAKASKKSYAYHKIHFDDMIGNVGYGVSLNSEGGGYHYRLCHDEDFQKDSHYFDFEGLLKPLK